MDLADLPVVKK